MSDEFFQIEGIEDVCELFERAPRELIPGALLKGLSAGGAVIENAMRVRIPEKTGDLAADLGTSITLDADFRGGVAQVGFTAKEAHKANWLEFGHRMVGHKPDKKELGEVPAHPFMRPAADASQEEAGDAMVETMMGELQKGQLVDAA